MQSAAVEFYVETRSGQSHSYSGCAARCTGCDRSVTRGIPVQDMAQIDVIAQENIGWKRMHWDLAACGSELHRLRIVGGHDILEASGECGGIFSFALGPGREQNAAGSF